MTKLTEKHLRNHKEYKSEEKFYYSHGYYNRIRLGGLTFDAVHVGDDVEIQVEVCGENIVITKKEDFDKFLKIVQKGL